MSSVFRTEAKIVEGSKDFDMTDPTTLIRFHIPPYAKIMFPSYNHETGMLTIHYVTAKSQVIEVHPDLI